MNPSKNKPSHLRALLRKNWILWQRSWCVSCLEIIVPLLFAAIMVAFRKVAPVADVPQDAYYSKSAWLFDYDGVFTSADLQYFKDCAGDSNGGMVALVPNAQDTATHNIMGSLKSTLENDLGLTTQIFNSLDDINEFTSNNDYGKSLSLSLCFAVVMDQANAGGTYQYQLIFNTSQTNDDKTDLPKTLLPRIATIDTEDNKTLSKYARSGFLALQNMLDNLILRAETGDTSANIETQVTSRMVEAYVEDDLAANMKGQTRLFIDLPLLLPYLRLLNGIIREKEKKIKEGMKIMGLSNSAFYLSWFITYFIIFTIISILISLVLVAGFFEKSTFGYVFLWHWEFSICLMCLAFLVSVFFSKAKQGNVAGFVIALLFGFFQSLADSDNATQGALLGCSLAPQTSVGLAADHILSLEAAGLGLNSDTVSLEVSNYKMSYHYGIMLFDVILFVLLGSYLDQVLPSEFGLRKHPLFCCMRKKKKTPKTRISQSKEDEANMIENADNFEETDPNLKLQDQSNESVMVQNLRKVYASGKVAVDGVSFSMYKSQIFALLGHNGAGKTSTISMITGLFGSTDGTTSIFGMDNQVELEEIRKIMGVCPQHDTLFDSLTVKEHLEMYAVFKGVNSKEIPQEVEKIIEDIGLVDKTDYLSKNLSGGQKRKLSIGIAFIGGSKFIVLDEPSSGMDTSARRKLWDMLKNYKNNRVVLLTTHFMDEADYLGDRIGIMGEGKLKCLGRPLFLKSRFGVGYNLTLVKKDINDPSKPIKDLILNHVPEGKVLSDVSAEVAIQLPLETAPKFHKLFEELDQNLQKLSVSSYGISVTTLEEVFLNVAKVTTPEKHFQKEEDSPGFLDNNEDLNEFDLRKEGIKGKWAIFAGHFKALVIKRVHYFKRDKRGLICEVFLPIIMIIAGILLGKVQFVKQNPPLLLSDNLYDFKFPVTYPTTPGAGGTGYSAFISNFDTSYFTMTAVTPNAADPACTSTSDPLCPWNEVVYAAQGQSVLYDTVNVFSIYMHDYASTSNQYKYTTFINTRAQEGSAFAANKINNAILKQATNNANVKINTIVNSFQKTPGYQTIDKIFEGITFAFVFAIGMSFIPASVITFIVKERELNVKHQQIVSGVSLTAYWLSNYFVDIVKYLIPAVINALLAMAFDASALIEGDKLAGLWSIFILYGFGITSFVYLISFLFKDYGTAQIASFFFNFGTGFIGGAAISILRLFDTTRSVAKALQWILRPLPTFSMTYGFLNLANREAYALTEDTEVLPVFNIGLLGGDVIFLIGAAFFYMAMVFLVEKLKNRQPLALMLTRENNVPYVPKEMDDDVKREELEVEQSDNKTYSIKVDKLRKVYSLGGNKHKVAVDRVSFGVKNGECFALLGVNGAGKTTTFKILSGDYVQTSGNAYINGYSVPNEMDEARKDIGYCPQFDALLENLTAKEHLNLYASIKGIPTHFRQRLVEKQLREMNLKQYENIPAGTYSGGNKRKLSVAIAMIGNPAVVFLDEPSTGMDPEARRFMWNVISRISRERQQSSVILTTHSMEEAEALATKMGIMVNGNLKCMGTSQHIKNKFGGGYEIEVKLNLPSQSQIDGLLKNLGYVSGETINKQSVEEILDKMKLAHFKSEIKDDGTGSAIHAELKKGKTTANLVAEWILIETNGEQLKAFLNENFGDMIVIEHFQSFFRFKTKAAVSVGKFFGGLEANKSKLNILQYAIRQSTIEQIFNNFATEKIPVQAGIHTAVPINNAANE